MYEYEGLPPPCCPDCQALRNEQFFMVREVVRECPGITALQVHHVTEVPMDVILRFIEKGMIEVVPTVNKNGQLDDRIGIMIKKAKDLHTVFKNENTQETQLDEMHPKEQKLTWLGQ